MKKRIKPRIKKILTITAEKTPTNSHTASDKKLPRESRTTKIKYSELKISSGVNQRRKRRGRRRRGEK